MVADVEFTVSNEFLSGATGAETIKAKIKIASQQ